MRLFSGTKYDQPPKCDRCGKLETECSCSLPAARWIAPASQVAHLRLEKRTKGKVVTVIRGLSPEGNDLPALLSRLKSQCGAGGAVQEECVEIQGDHVQRISSLLADMGYQVRR